MAVLQFSMEFPSIHILVVTLVHTVQYPRGSCLMSESGLSATFWKLRLKFWSAMVPSLIFRNFGPFTIVFWNFQNVSSIAVISWYFRKFMSHCHQTDRLLKLRYLLLCQEKARKLRYFGVLKLTGIKGFFYHFRKLMSFTVLSLLWACL